jgi:hypothetical protein
MFMEVKALLASEETYMAGSRFVDNLVSSELSCLVGKNDEDNIRLNER